MVDLKLETWQNTSRLQATKLQRPYTLYIVCKRTTGGHTGRYRAICGK